VLAAGARRWSQQGTLPAGPDGGQWLALGRGLLGGVGRSTDGAYPPLVPLVVAGLEPLLGPLDALKVVAIGSYLAVVAAFLLVAKDGLGWALGLAAAAALAGATALAEPTAFGGYPQQVAFAGVLLAGWALARSLAAGRRRDLVLAGLAFAATALAHHLYFPLALAVAATVWLGWLTTRPPRATAVARSAGAAAAVGLGVACFGPTVLAFRRAGYAPPFDAAGFGAADAFRYGTRESPALWALVILLGLAGYGLTARWRDPCWLLGLALTTVAAAALAASGEPRLLPPLLAGGLLGAGLGLRRLWQRAVAAGHGRAAVASRALVVALAVALPALVWREADRPAGEFFRYYRVLDPSLLDAADLIATRDDGSPVAVRHDRRGWPLGWWFEGLTDAPIVVGADPRWLGFPAERASAATAGRFFDHPLTGAELSALSTETGIDRLVFRKREWIGWQRWLDEPNPVVRVLFDDGVFMVVEVGSG